MNHWMIRLADHHRRFRRTHPEAKALIVFDIDGTILDMRHMILYVLKQFDKELGKGYFQHLDVGHIDFHEDHVHSLLDRLGVPEIDRTTILRSFENRLVAATALPESQRPFHGALDVIGWFQRQRNTFVGLNTGRPECLRENTLNTLNEWGRDHGVVFTNELLYMRGKDTADGISQAKVAGMDYFEGLGYQVIAFVDNEPENLRAVGDSDFVGKILLLHADTIFKSDSYITPERAVKGNIYDLTELVAKRGVHAPWAGPDDFDTDNDFRRIA